MQNYSNIYERLLNYADNMKIIDTHEHLQPDKNYMGDHPDVLCDYLSHYITTDLMSAGMSGSEIEKVCDCKTDIIERFKILESYLDRVKNTSLTASKKAGRQTGAGITG